MRKIEIYDDLKRKGETGERGRKRERERRIGVKREKERIKVYFIQKHDRTCIFIIA